MLRLPTRRVLSIAVAIVAVLALNVSALPAGAAWPGGNGRIAFARGGSIVSRTPGSATTTTLAASGMRPTYSPDGTKIAFMRYSEGPFSWDIWVMNANGSNKRNVTRGESRYFSVSWAPNGQRLLFSEYDGNPSGIVRLHLINLDGSNRRHFAPNVGGTMDEGVFSPDGTMVAYTGGSVTNPSTLRTVSANGAPSSVRVFAPTLTSVSAPDWSPNGAFLAFARQLDEPYKTMLFKVRKDRTGLVKIADFGTTSHAYEPAWSPGGTRILFTRRFQATGKNEIWRTNPDGTDKARVDANGYDPTWQPLK